MMKSHIQVFLLLALLLSAGASSADEDVYVISAEKKVSDFPQEVVSYGGSKLFDISELELKNEDGDLKASFSYVGKLDAVEYKIVLCTETENTMLVTFFYDDTRLTFCSPSGSAGNVVFTLNCHENEQAELSKTSMVPEGYSCGQFHLSLTTKVYGTYNISGKDKKVTVFLVNKAEGTRDDRFQAISNVLTGAVSASDK